MDELKYRVVASGRIAPEVDVTGAGVVHVAPPTVMGANTESDAAWLSQAPLPPPLAALACSGSLNAARWEEVATQAYQSGGNMKGWTRGGNCFLNGDGPFQWDIKLRRVLPPRYDPADPNLAYNKCKRSRKVLTALWNVFMDNKTHPALAGLPLDNPKAWVNMDEDELATRMAQIMSTCLAQGPQVQAQAPVPVQAVQGITGELRRFGELDPACLSLLFDAPTTQALRSGQLGVPVRVAPRWTQFPVIELQRTVLMRQGGTRARGGAEPVGEQFTLTFKNGE
jgi:hypothetical protein